MVYLPEGQWWGWVWTPPLLDRESYIPLQGRNMQKRNQLLQCDFYKNISISLQARMSQSLLALKNVLCTIILQYFFISRTGLRSCAAYRSWMRGRIHKGFPKLSHQSNSRKLELHPRQSLRCRRFLHRHGEGYPGSSYPHEYLRWKPNKMWHTFYRHTAYFRWIHAHLWLWLVS